MSDSDEICNKCGSGLKKGESTETRSLQVASARWPGDNGYYGESPEEYGVADRDLFRHYTRKIVTFYCPSCDIKWRQRGEEKDEGGYFNS